MLEAANKWRGEMMGKGGDDGLRTVECLRGRLLAERAASKAAKAEADLLANRLAELERKLAEEVKYRDRAEKKLKYAFKKLESLKLFVVSSQLNLPAISVSSSSACLSTHQRLKGQKPDLQVADSGQCGSMKEAEEKLDRFGSEDVGYVGSVDSSGGSPGQLVSQEESWSSVGTAHSHNKGESHEEQSKSQELAIVSILDGKVKMCSSLAHIKAYDKIQDLDFPELLHIFMHSSVKWQSSTSDNELESEKRQSESENNPLALVPVNMWPNSGGSKPEIKNDVQGVLLALRRVKEQLQSSVGRRAVLSSSKELYGR